MQKNQNQFKTKEFIVSGILSLAICSLIPPILFLIFDPFNGRSDSDFYYIFLLLVPLVSLPLIPFQAITTFIEYLVIRSKGKVSQSKKTLYFWSFGLLQFLYITSMTAAFWVAKELSEARCNDYCRYYSYNNHNDHLPNFFVVLLITLIYLIFNNYFLYKIVSNLKTKNPETSPGKNEILN